MTRPLCIIASYMADLILEVETFPRPGETVAGCGVGEGNGGKGSNQAVQAARCGAAVALLASLGRDAQGDGALALWRAEGIGIAALRHSAAARTGMATIAVDRRGENQIIINPGANAELGADLIAEAEPAIAEAALVMAQLETPLEAAAAAFACARRHGRPTLLNPAPAAAALPPTLWSDIDIIVPNRLEAAALGAAGAEPEAIAEALAARVGRAAILTLGGDGAIVAERRGRLTRLPALAVPVLDTTGAGDAFIGAFAARLAETDDLIEAARWGIVAGSLACSGRGVVPALQHRAAIVAALAGLPAR